MSGQIYPKAERKEELLASVNADQSHLFNVTAAVKCRQPMKRI